MSCWVAYFIHPLAFFLLLLLPAHRNAWFHTGLIGAQVLTVYYESMSLEFRKTLWDIVEYIGLERFVTEADMDKVCIHRWAYYYYLFLWHCH